MNSSYSTKEKKEIFVDSPNNTISRAGYMGRDPRFGPFNPQSTWVRTKHFFSSFIHGFSGPLRLTRGLNGLVRLSVYYYFMIIKYDIYNLTEAFNITFGCSLVI